MDRITFVGEFKTLYLNNATYFANTHVYHKGIKNWDV